MDLSDSGHFEFEKKISQTYLFMYIYHPNTKMTHKKDGFIENLMKVPAPLNLFSLLVKFSLPEKTLP